MTDTRRAAQPFLVLLVLVALAVAVVACGGGDDSSDTTTTGAGSGVQVALEPVGSTGEDPFTDSVAIAETAQLPAATNAAIAATLATATPDPTTGGITTTGTTPGLYGGTGDTTTCNVDTLTTYLTDPANTTKAAAFATVLGITPDTITDTLATFTPVVLTIDTLVTNHGFRNNTANPFPAILQAGTAVLVDQTGTPRVKCGCGNPLTPPPTNTDLTTTTGTPWTTFDPTTTATITPAPQPTDTLTLLDTTTGDTYQHPTGSTPAEPTTTTTTAPPTTTTTTAPAAPSGPPDVDLDNLPPGICDDGADAFVSPATPGPVTAAMDVDGDGSLELLATVFCSPGGSSYVWFLVVAFGEGGAVVGAPLAYETDATGGIAAPVISALHVEGDELVIDGLDFGPNDAHCCPSIPATTRWQPSAGGWTRVA